MIKLTTEADNIESLVAHLFNLADYIKRQQLPPSAYVGLNATTQVEHD